MSALPTVDGFVPQPPAWRLDWDGIAEAFPWIRELRGSPHDPVHHPEGDPWIHTRMVCEELRASADWRSLDPDRQRAGFAAALLHDVAKPRTARISPDGRVSHPGHSALGAVQARGILWRQGFPPRLREMTCVVIAAHEVPFYLAARPWATARPFVAAQSLTSGNRLLAVVAAADALGRGSADRLRLAEAVELFREIALEEGCYDAPFRFADPLTRFRYLASDGTTIDPRWPLHASAEMPEMILMSGLPGSGKTTWLAAHRPDLPVVSLDAIRERTRTDPHDDQGPVAQAAREEMRAHLRRRQPFAFDATNLTRELRAQAAGLAVDYGFRVVTVALEAGPDETARRLADRERRVPDAAFERMLGRWQHPVPGETHELVSEAYPAEACGRGLAAGASMGG